jgi:1,2-dihydroxy-3-keto-5-methylthiopentene dioxygenase
MTEVKSDTLPPSTSTSDAEVTEPKTKKMKSTPMPQAPESEWPEAWIMPNAVEDQKALNKLEPNEPVTPEMMKELGVAFWKMDAESFTYPVKSVPWDPKDSMDPRLSQIRDDRGYSYADIITVHPDHLPGYEEKVKSFFEEHIHDAEEIRYILGGSGFFDVRDKEDRWIRVHIKKGDLMTLPEGIYHRFTTDETDMIHAMRLFIGQPVWTPFNRPCEDHPSRKKFVEGIVSKE